MKKDYFEPDNEIREIAERLVKATAEARGLKLTQAETVTYRNEAIAQIRINRRNGKHGAVGIMHSPMELVICADCVHRGEKCRAQWRYKGNAIIAADRAFFDKRCTARLIYDADTGLLCWQDRPLIFPDHAVAILYGCERDNTALATFVKVESLNNRKEADNGGER